VGLKPGDDGTWHHVEWFIGRVTVAGGKNGMFRKLWALMRRVWDFIQDNDNDLQGTYPDHFKPTGSEAALQGSVTTGLMGSGGIGGT